MSGFVHLDPAAIPANPFIRLNPADNVAVARVSLPANAQVEFEGAAIRVSQAVAAGHKVAVAEIAKGGEFSNTAKTSAAPAPRFRRAIGFTRTICCSRWASASTSLPRR